MKRVVLAGAGHAHAQVLRAWRDAPVAGVELVVVSPQALAPYSGMVPGWLAGHYRFDDIVIDFRHLCRQAGARFVPSTIDRLRTDQQNVLLENGESLHYDWLSLNVGSTLAPPGGHGGSTMLSMRPLSSLRADYEPLLQRWRADRGDQPWRVTVVGGGAAGFESILAVLRRLRDLRPDRQVHGTLVAQSGQLLPGHSVAARRKAMRALQDAGVSVHLSTSWSESTDRDSDLVLWATGASAQAWQRAPERRGGLAVSDQGFVLIDACLRSPSHPNIFAAGDCAQWLTPLPKAGVYAVRMGPVLAHNLRAALIGQPLQTYTPQTAFLSLLATADGGAIASRGSLAVSGQWAWRWKDRIDRRFVNRFV